MSDFVALGEILIDFMPRRAPDGRPLYDPHIGGAPANVARAVAVLGHSSAFIGKVGSDSFGQMCKDALAGDGVDISDLITDPEHPTTLAFVHLSDEGERSFSFYRKQTADVSLETSDVSTDLIDSARIFHVGSVSLSDNPSADTTLEAVRYARSKGITVTYDPNLRPRLWRDLEGSKDVVLAPMEACDVLKVSAEEVEFVSGESDPETAARLLHERYGIPLILISLDKQGCCALHNGQFYYEPAFAIQPVDTTGAGDCFFAGILHSILEAGCAIADLTGEQVQGAMRFANAMGAAAALHMGASCPAIEKVQELMATH